MDEAQLPVVVAQAVRRASRKDFPRWEAMVHAAGCCAQPVRLAGRVLAVDPDSGELNLVYSSAAEADRVLLKACGTRRATRCPACASTYRGDAKALLRAGLALNDEQEGIGPVVFVTLTAPSFGPVHRAFDAPRSCRPDPRTTVCRHGRPAGCAAVHDPGDPVVGSAVCDECYEWEQAVMFNARVGDLWRRTVIAANRHLAGAAGLSVRAFAGHYRLAFAKVVEFQTRGVVHVHALARLDQLHPGGRSRLDGVALADALAAAASRAATANPLDPERPIRWGTQTDIEPIPAGRRRAAAAYLAKYATKSVDRGGALDRRLRHGDLSAFDLSEQLARMAATAWQLGGRPELARLNLRAWAHSLGYRGHWLTKSRHWSTTFGQLRAARQRFRLAQLGLSEADLENRLGEWDYQGVGHQNAGDAWLAASANAERRLNRRTAWEEG